MAETSPNSLSALWRASTGDNPSWMSSSAREATWNSSSASTSAIRSAPQKRRYRRQAGGRRFSLGDSSTSAFLAVRGRDDLLYGTDVVGPRRRLVAHRFPTEPRQLVIPRAPATLRDAPLGGDPLLVL